MVMWRSFTLGVGILVLSSVAYSDAPLAEKQVAAAQAKGDGWKLDEWRTWGAKEQHQAWVTLSPSRRAALWRDLSEAEKKSLRKWHGFWLLLPENATQRKTEWMSAGDNADLGVLYMGHLSPQHKKEVEEGLKSGRYLPLSHLERKFVYDTRQNPRSAVIAANRYIVNICKENTPNGKAVMVDTHNKRLLFRNFRILWYGSQVKYFLMKLPGGKIVINLHVRLNIDPKISVQRRAEMIKMAKGCSAPMRQKFEKYGLQFDVKLDEDSNLSADHEVNFHDAASDSMDVENFYTKFEDGQERDHTTFCGSLLHELGHLMGLPDEYKSPVEAEEKISFEFPRSSMSNAWPKDDMENLGWLLARYDAQIPPAFRDQERLFSTLQKVVDWKKKRCLDSTDDVKDLLPRQRSHEEKARIITEELIEREFYPRHLQKILAPLCPALENL